MNVYLSVEGEGSGLTLGADTARPRGMLLTALLDLTRDVLQVRKLASVPMKAYRNISCSMFVCCVLFCVFIVVANVFVLVRAICHGPLKLDPI